MSVASLCNTFGGWKEVESGFGYRERSDGPDGMASHTPESLQRTHKVKIEKDELFICLSNEDNKRPCRSDSYAYNKAAGQQVLGRVDTRAGSDGVMRSSGRRVPSGKVFNKGRKTAKTTTRKTGSLMFRVQSAPVVKEIVEEEEEEMDIDSPERESDGKARSRRVALEPDSAIWIGLEYNAQHHKSTMVSVRLQHRNFRDIDRVMIYGLPYEVKYTT